MTWRMLVAVAGLLGATLPSAAQAPLVANEPLRTINVALAASGMIHRYRVEVARTDVQQARGLMARSVMARSHGMIFPMEPPREAGFWMEGTILPLDLVFIAPDNTVRRIASHAVPFDRTVIPSNGVVKAVLELNAGEAERIGLKPGDMVRYTLD